MHPSDPNYVMIPARRGPGLFAVIVTAAFTSALVSAATVVAFARLGGDAFALLLTRPASPRGAEQVRVPDVVGMPAGSADELLQARKLRFVVRERRADSTVPAGSVVEQTPLAQSRMEPGGEVEVVVSTGSDRIVVPDILGKPLEDAQRALEALGLRIGSQLEVDSGEPGTVTTVSPQPGTEVEPGTSVSVAVARARVAVPKLVGDHIREARERLKKAGLAVGDVSEIYNRRRKGNVVLTQQPEAGAAVPIGTKVRLVINQGD